MKRTLAFLLMVVFLMCSIMATNAEVVSRKPIGEVNLSDGMDPKVVNEDWDQGTKYIYRTVKIIYENDPNDPDDDVENSIRPAVAIITYAFCGTWSTISKCYTGGYVLKNGDWPRYTALTNSTIGYPLNVSFGSTNYPAQATVTGVGDQYKVDIAGGTYTISYNSVLRYNKQGVLVSTERATDTLIHSFEYTGSNPDE